MGRGRETEEIRVGGGRSRRQRPRRRPGPERDRVVGLPVRAPWPSLSPKVLAMFFSRLMTVAAMVAPSSSRPEGGQTNAEERAHATPFTQVVPA